MLFEVAFSPAENSHLSSREVFELPGFFFAHTNPGVDSRSGKYPKEIPVMNGRQRPKGVRARQFLRALRETAHALASRPRPGERLSIKMAVEYHGQNDASLTVRVRVD
jgi:hypothetical protein